MMNTRTVSYVCLLATIFLAGCSDLASVSGTVTLDGEPLEGSQQVRGTVLLHPAAGGAAAVGMVDGEGYYDMKNGSTDGVAPGQYLATVTATQILLPKDPDGTPSGRLLARKTGVPVDVEPGSNTLDIALESGK